MIDPITAAAAAAKHMLGSEAFIEAGKSIEDTFLKSWPIAGRNMLLTFFMLVNGIKNELIPFKKLVLRGL